MNFLKTLFHKKPKVAKVDLTRRFDFIGRVGQGSMSKVWRVRDAMTGKMLALKVLDMEKVRRFESRFVGLNKPTEGEIAIQLIHPNIVRTYEHGISTDGSQFMVMEFISGVSMSFLVEMQNEIMQRNRLRFIVQIGNALDYFHRQHWIHRDMCPRNVLLDVDYQVKLIDFGLVVPDTDDFRRPGNRTGTAHYMAPELIKRQQTDQRIDIFSFATGCYEMYAKRFPWDTTTGLSLEMVLHHINRPPKDIREFVPDIDENVADAIMKGLALHPDDRWQTTSDMLVPLREAQRRIEGIDDDVDDDEYEELTRFVDVTDETPQDDPAS